VQSTNGNLNIFAAFTSKTYSILNSLSRNVFNINFDDGKTGIGTSSPFAFLSVFTGGDYAAHAASTVFAIGSTTAGTATTTLFSINSDGHLIVGGTTPTVISGASAAFGSDLTGSTTPSVGATRLIYIMFAQAFSRPPHCQVNINLPSNSVALGTTTTIYTVSTTTTQFAITASAANLGGSTVDWWCPSN
jgi:hypothetical protein